MFGAQGAARSRSGLPLSKTRPAHIMKTPARAARAARTGPRRRRRAARTSSVALAARRRAPAAARVARRRASAAALVAVEAGALAAVARARRWAGSGAASTSWTTRRYCYSAQCRTRFGTTRRCRRSGRCPARQPAATASRWSRPPTRAACTSGRRRGVPLLCCGSSFRLPYQQYRSRAACYRCIRTAGIIEVAPATNGTYECSRSLFYAQSASVTSQLAEIVRVGRLTGGRYVSLAPRQWIEGRFQASRKP